MTRNGVSILLLSLCLKLEGMRIFDRVAFLHAVSVCWVKNKILEMMMKMSSNNKWHLNSTKMALVEIIYIKLCRIQINAVDIKVFVHMFFASLKMSLNETGIEKHLVIIFHVWKLFIEINKRYYLQNFSEEWQFFIILTSWWHVLFFLSKSMWVLHCDSSSESE